MLTNSAFPVYLLVLYCALAYSATPIDIGLCSPKTVTCNCGEKNGLGSNYNVYLEVKQCTRFYRWKPYCGECTDEDSDENKCSVYAYCMDCEANTNECVRCPPDRFGRWCTGVCPRCANDGYCNRNKGTCICPDLFIGRHCEQMIGCYPPPSISGGSFHPVSQTYYGGSSVTYQCDDRHSMEGTPRVFCANNTWLNVPSCNLINDCPDPIQPANGIVHREHQSNTLVYACSPDYELIGDTTRHCVNSTWTGREPVCVKVIKCNFPAPPEHGHVQSVSVNQNSLIPGTAVHFTCQQNYSLMGEEKVVCDENGIWSSPTPACIHQDLTCPHPGNVPESKITILGGEYGKTAYQVGTTIHFSCNSFHYLFGNKSITCNSDNTWSGNLPSCIKVITCPAFESIRSGRVDIFAPDSTSDSVFRVRSPNIASRGVIGPRFRSGHPTVSPESRVAALSIRLPPGYYHVGTRASFSCESRYYNLIGSRIRTCQPSGEWSGRPPTCIPICGRSSAPRTPLVTHGTPSSVGQWPWVVGMARRLEENDPLGEWFVMCGASVVNEQWVVTAAHCVTYSGSTVIIPMDELRLYFGKYYRNDTMDDELVQVRDIAEIHVHPDFEPSTFESDIALLRMSSEVRFTSRVQPICLPRNEIVDGERLEEGNLGTVIGWGMKEDDTFSDVLQHVQVPIVRQRKCQEEYQNLGVPVVISANMICAGNETGGYDSCSGDSGGPFVFPMSSNSDRWVLEGIVSWGSPFGCGNEKQYGGYARVRKFVDWIDNFI